MSGYLSCRLASANGCTLVLRKKSKGWLGSGKTADLSTTPREFLPEIRPENENHESSFLP
jgi:hypothetical protein